MIGETVFWFVFCCGRNNEACNCMSLSQVEDGLQAAIVDEINKDQYVQDGAADPPTYTTFGAAMNQFQWKFDCCGVNNYTDYESSEKWPMTIVCVKCLFYLQYTLFD